MYEKVFDVLEAMLYANEAPFVGTNRNVIAGDLLYLVTRWLRDSTRGGGILFDGETGAARVDQMLQTLLQVGAQAGLDQDALRTCHLVREQIAQLLH